MLDTIQKQIKQQTCNLRTTLQTCHRTIASNNAFSIIAAYLYGDVTSQKTSALENLALTDEF